MPQLPSGLKVALTLEPILNQVKKGNFGFNLLTKANILESYDSLPEVVSIIYLSPRADAADYRPGTQSIEGGKYDFPKLQLIDVGTERCDWTKEDLDFFKSWLSDEATQQWLKKSYEELVEALKTTQTILPENLKGIFDMDDFEYSPFNLDQPEQEFPDSVIKVIGELITRDNVQSVSFPFNNSHIWQMLVNEQLRRAKITGFFNQKAFTLSGPDSGLTCDPTNWGGDVHIPYEGCCMGDLFVMPGWRNLYTARENAILGDYATHWADPKIGQSCHYLLLKTDLGELHCATRQIVGDGWFLYESNLPYEKNNMSGIAGYPRES